MEQRWALITGASGAIGRQIAILLAQDGINLYLHYHKNKDGLSKLAIELEQRYFINVRIVCADLAQPDGVAHIIEQLTRMPHILIHNAGISLYGLFTEVSQGEYNQQLQLHLTSPFQLTQAIVPHMLQHKWGRIIFISSIWGETGASYEVLYSTLKGAQISFMKSLAKELAPSAITVNSVSPGAIQSDMLKDFTEEERAAMVEEIPTDRLGLPEEVAYAVQFLTANKSAYITGHVLRVNGGWYT